MEEGGNNWLSSAAAISGLTGLMHASFSEKREGGEGKEGCEGGAGQASLLVAAAKARAFKKDDVGGTYCLSLSHTLPRRIQGIL